MTLFNFRNLTLIERIRWLRYVLPPIIALIVVFYQLGVAATLHDVYGHAVHYLVEIGFYSLGGPIVTWITLIWIERGLEEKETLENQVRVQSHQIASLASASADAIVSLDKEGNVASWNIGAVKLFGHSAKEIIGKPMKGILLDFASFERRLQSGIVENFEVEASTRGGRPITVNLTYTRSQEDPNGSQASLLIMRDVTARREREAILEEERGRIARDLHDGVAQSLYFLALKTDMAQKQIVDNPEKVALDLKEMGQEARRVIREVRRTIFSLNPLDWSEDGFHQTLQEFIMRFSEQVDWEIDVDIDSGVANLPPSMEPTLFRLVQESLNNIAKHAHANKLSLKLFINEDLSQVELILNDDGIGFDMDNRNTSGLGLDQMQARVEALGGKFEIHSEAGKGTDVYASIPLTGEKS